MQNILENKESWKNILKMNDWIEYAVPKKYSRMYRNAMLRNMMVFLFFTMLFGIFPSGFSVLVLMLITDFIFYQVVIKGGKKY